jgi:hypothetical protein
MRVDSQPRAVASLLTVLCPTVCCVGVGLIARGTQVFAPKSGLFQLGLNAVIVGVLVLIAQQRPTRRFLAAGAAITIIMTAMTARSGPRIVLHTTVLMAMWVGAVFLNVKVLSRYRWVQAVGRCIVWAFVFAVGLFVAGVVLMVLFRPAEMRSHLVFYAELAILTGIGLGIGFKARDWLAAGAKT